ncbi:MAG: amylo-alpha-1,6-glucosidase, partial [Deltaproteobacteria bacterium]
MTDSPKRARVMANPSDLPEATGVEKLVLKRGNLFAVTTRLGDIAPAGARDQGFFFDDTRYLSHLKLTVAGGPPICLSTQTSPEYVSQIDLTVAHLDFGGVFQGDPVNFLHLRREQMIDIGGEGEGGSFIDHFTLTNFLSKGLDYWIELEFGADMADVFEVRGATRARRGRFEPPVVEGRSVVYRYLGTDGRRYATELVFHGRRVVASEGRVRFEFHLEPNESETVALWVTPTVDADPCRCSVRPFDARVRENQKEFERWSGECTAVETGDELFDLALSQGIADLKALGVVVDGRPILSAGIPWYTAPFGRDAIITAIQALPFTARPAKEALCFLAHYQGTKDDPSRDEEPGKMPHELRFGEMARAAEIPHTPYYGSVDVTPLWLILLSEYFLWTGDRETVEALLPNADRAIAWMEAADRDGDGLVEYQRRAERGLRNQGWKDSSDGICFPDGTPAEPPIALIEVQGYVLDACRRMAQLYHRLGRPGRSKRLGERA